MNTATFTATTVNPNVLTPHSYLVDMGYFNKSDAFFSAAVKYFNHYDAPVIDMDMRILTHSAFVDAAITNGVTEMKAYQVDLNDIDVRKLVATMHKYHRKDLIASYNTINYYEDYLNNNEDGIALSETMEGDINDKIAILMQTSAPTIKRLKNVGEHKIHMLGLIQEGEKGMKEVLDEIKHERQMGKSLERKLAQTQPELPPAYTAEVASAQDLEEPQEDYYQEPVGQSVDKDEINNKKTHLIPSTPVYTSTVSTTPLIFPEGLLSIGGLGELGIQVTDNIPYLTVNGKKIEGCTYESIVNRDSEINGIAQSFIIQQPGKNGISISLTIENFKRAA